MKRLWLTATLVIVGLLTLRAEDHPAVKTFEGTLKTGVVAIGGETTGVMLRTKSGESYDLDFGAHPALARLAEKLNGKAVIVTGESRVRAGIEVKERPVIEVATLAGAKR